ncbi:hypothetical protein RQP46_008329 [Phenoliferia psychrophenolica]
MPPKASTSQGGDAPFSLPAFLKLLTTPQRQKKALSMHQAIQAAGKLIPAGANTLEKIKALSQTELAGIGIADEELRKGLAALSRSGKASPGKRKRGSDLDRPLPTSESQANEVIQMDYDFEEILHVEALLIKSVVVNRAPVLTAWACVCAERLGFKRQEALSIAQSFTDVTASAKGVSLGILPASAARASAGSSQPYVELMGRQIPVLTMQDGEWRGITKGAVAEPAQAWSYLQRAFRQQLGAVVGALRLLADSFEADELARIGFSLYADFRPESDGGAKGWGQKAEMKLRTILDLRRAVPNEDEAGLDDGEEVKEEEDAGVEEGLFADDDDDGSTARKKPKLEEEEDEFGGEDVDWGSVPDY